jgi:hypothetical protein
MLVQIVPAQSAAHKGPPKPPRALGLLQLAPNGKAHLIPITILYDGEFYDASAYKAAPVPMALESGTVYEALRTGVSQGLFTVSTALQANNTWIGDGTWQSASALAAAAAKKKTVPSKPPAEPVQGPPVLRRRADLEKAKAPEPEPLPPPAEPAPASTTPAPASTTSTPPSAPAASAPAQPPVSTAEEEDPDRPVLKRGAPSPAEKKKVTASQSTPAKGAAHTASSSASSSAASSVPAPSSAASSTMQLIPAISDSDGPDPRPYAYDTKPDEEQKLRKTMLSLAADEVRARATQLAAGPVGSAPAAPSSASGPSKSESSKSSSSKSVARPKLPQPTFEDTQLRIFDLSNSNEPVLVLTTKARMPSRPNALGANAPSGDLQYIVTLVGREDIYGEVHKAFSSITDTQHLDVLPRMELIDAVDADGDGRGELLFRQISDAGKAFVLYRVIGDRLWPLFEETPQ